MKFFRLIWVAMLSACSTPTLFVAQQGRPPSLYQALQQILPAHGWQLSEFSNHIDPPHIDAPLLIYGTNSDLGALKVALDSSGLEPANIIFQRTRNHRVSENNAVLYFPVAESNSQPRFMFSVSCGEMSYEVYAYGNGQARIESAQWSKDRDQWVAVATVPAHWQIEQETFDVRSHDNSIRWPFVRDWREGIAAQWQLSPTGRDDQCRGQIWHDSE